MKKLILLSILVFTSINIVLSQAVVTLVHNTTSQVFTGSQPFIDAYNASVSGDKIYLSGMSFTTPTEINKKLSIYGTGHYPDSTQATGISRITGFTLRDGADGSLFEGLTITGNLDFQSNEKIDSVKIYRNNISGRIGILGSNNGNQCNQVVISGNVLGHVNAENASNLKVFNNILSYVTLAKNNAWIANNVFLIGYYSFAISNCENILIENNIFHPLGGSNGLSNFNTYCTFKNNTFWFDPTGDTFHTWIGNFVNTNATTILVNYTTGVFSYSHNYHLQNPATYVGSNGTEIGIYGGYMPYKEGAVPTNPHIISKSIANNTDTNGNLNINFKVKAQ